MLIRNQSSPEIASLPYGKSTVGKSGCAAAAVFNALQLLGKGTDFRAVLNQFETLFSRGGGFFAHGRLGASPLDLRRILKRLGFNAKGGFLRKLKNISAPGVFIITYWNKPLKCGAHTVAVSFDGESYTAYNCGGGQCVRQKLSDFAPTKAHFIYGFYIKKDSLS